MKSVIGAFLTLFVIAKAAELPNGFRTCHRSDPQYYDCLNKAVVDAIISMRGGLKSFRILPLEPLAVDSVKIGESQGPVTLKQEYKNIKLHGLTQGLQVKNYNIDFNNWVLRSDGYCPQVDFVADYKVDGRVLLLPIRGAGKSNITMYDLETKNTIYCEEYEKNGEKYLRVKKYDIKFHPRKVILQFDNLFDGDTVLGEEMNKFINQNSDLLFKELQSPYEETFGLVFTKISNDIFSRIPISKIFPM
ncbi:protein takeout [Orussus abietinus]|uniref:protein takeout n=1 Tax=Orussus abietinus TaxID=222816 RepID=UPI0006261407|nr:protein takeout [Orussus abietinus]